MPVMSLLQQLGLVDDSGSPTMLGMAALAGLTGAAGYGGMKLGGMLSRSPMLGGRLAAGAEEALPAIATRGPAELPGDEMLLRALGNEPALPKVRAATDSEKMMRGLPTLSHEIAQEEKGVPASNLDWAHEGGPYEKQEDVPFGDIGLPWANIGMPWAGDPTMAGNPKFGLPPTTQAELARLLDMLRRRYPR